VQHKKQSARVPSDLFFSLLFDRYPMMKNIVSAFALLALATSSIHAAPAAKRSAAPEPAPALCKINGLEAKAAKLLGNLDSEDLEKAKNSLLEEVRLERASCLRRQAENASAAQRSSVAQQLARNESVVVQQLQDALATVEADPVRYLSPIVDELEEDAEKILDDARKVRSVSDVCGTWSSYLSGSYDSNAAARLNERVTSFRNCVEKMKSADTEAIDSTDLEDIRDGVQRLQRFSCSASSSPKCLPRQDLDKVRKLASQANIRMVERASQTSARLAEEADEALESVEQTIRRFNDGVARADQEEEERETRRAQRQYQYTPPAAPAQEYRRQGSVSAAGIR
jgi:hypothetical protein